MKKLFLLVMFLLFSVTAFAQGTQQAEEKYIVHVGYQFGKYTPDSTGLANAITYLNTVVSDANEGIIWLDYPVDSVGQGAISNIHLMGWVVNSTDTNWVTSAGQADISGALAVTGNATVGGTLGVTGATTLSSTLGAGNTTVTGTLAVTGNSTFGGTLQGGTFNFATPAMITAGGSADSIIVNFTSDLPTATAGLSFMFIAEAANTGATVVNVDGAGWVAVVEASDGSALEAGDIANGMMVHLVYDGTSWVQISQSGN